MQTDHNLPLISANLISTDQQGLIFEPYQIVEKDGMKIGITGVTSEIPEKLHGLGVKDYLTTGAEIINEIDQKVDLVVILVNTTYSDFAKIKQEFADADYIFTSGFVRRTREAEKQPDDGPFVYSVGNQGKRLGVINLEITDSQMPIIDTSAPQRVIKTVNKRLTNLQKRDPGKALTELYANNPNVLRLIEDYQARLENAEQSLETAVNRSEYQLLSLDKKITDDNAILDLVNPTIKECRQLTHTARSRKTKLPIKRPSSVK